MKTAKLIRRAALPRFAYTHIVIEREHVHSMIHVQNPFSFFRPEEPPHAVAHLSLHDVDGRHVAKTCLTIPPFGTLALPMPKVFPEMSKNDFLGTIRLDLRPPTEYHKHVLSNYENVRRLGSPFWIRLSSESGSQGYVHSIELDHKRVSGFDCIPGRMLFRDLHQNPWTSHRTIDLTPQWKATAFLINHSPKKCVQSLEWRDTTGATISETRRSLRPRAMMELSTPEKFEGSVFLMSSGLATLNGKPYVIVDGPTGFGFTHG